MEKVNMMALGRLNRQVAEVIEIEDFVIPAFNGHGDLTVVFPDCEEIAGVTEEEMEDVATASSDWPLWLFRAWGAKRNIDIRAIDWWFYNKK